MSYVCFALGETVDFNFYVKYWSPRFSSEKFNHLTEFTVDSFVSCIPLDRYVTGTKTCKTYYFYHCTLAFCSICSVNCSYKHVLTCCMWNTSVCIWSVCIWNKSKGPCFPLALQIRQSIHVKKIWIACETVAYTSIMDIELI